MKILKREVLKMGKMIEGKLIKADLCSGDIVELLSGARFIYVSLGRKGVLLSPFKSWSLSSFNDFLCSPKGDIIKVFRIPEDYLPSIDYIFGNDLDDAWLVWERKQSAREKAIADSTQLIEDVGRVEKKLRDML